MKSDERVPVAYAKRIRLLERELKKNKTLVEDLREKNLVLERRDQMRSDNSNGANIPVAFQPSAGIVPVNDGEVSTEATLQEMPSPSAYKTTAGVNASSTVPSRVQKRVLTQSSVQQSVKESNGGPKTVAAVSVPDGSKSAALPAKEEQASVESVGAAHTGEHFLYSKILETYRSRNSEELQKSLQFLLKTYPESVFADNGLYLAGLISLEENDLPRALRFMDRVMSEFPRGNKTVSAMFAKATIEKRMKRYADARQTLIKIKTLFPGSPEASRVALELKMLDASSSNKRREM